MNVVEQINNAMKTRIASLLASPWAELNYVLDVGKNEFKGNTKRYGVRPLNGDTVSGVTRHYTINQDFEVILTHDYIPHPTNDVDQRAKTFLLYDKMDVIFKDLFCSKANLNTIILNIEELNMAEPEYSLAENVVVLRALFTVKYRQAVTSL